MGGRAASTPSRDGPWLPELLLASCSGLAQPRACALVVGDSGLGIGKNQMFIAPF